MHYIDDGVPGENKLLQSLKTESDLLHAAQMNAIAILEGLPSAPSI